MCNVGEGLRQLYSEAELWATMQLALKEAEGGALAVKIRRGTTQIVGQYVNVTLD